MTRVVVLADQSQMDSWAPVVAAVVLALLVWWGNRPGWFRSLLRRVGSAMLGPSDDVRWAAIPVDTRALAPFEKPASPVCASCGIQRVRSAGEPCGVCLSELDADLDEPGRWSA